MRIEFHYKWSASPLTYNYTTEDSILLIIGALFVTILVTQKLRLYKKFEKGLRLTDHSVAVVCEDTEVSAGDFKILAVNIQQSTQGIWCQRESIWM